MLASFGCEIVTVLSYIMRIMEASETRIFTDGASSGNPGPGGWGAIILFPDKKIQEIGGHEPDTTNNRMEMKAAICSLQKSSSDETVIFTDSTYLIQGITQWIFGWKKRGWKTAEGKPVLNQDLWQELDQAVAGRKVRWQYVPGHAGVKLNERADEIAVSFSKGIPVSLMNGSLEESDFEWKDFEVSGEAKPRAKKKSSKKGKPYSYLSKVGGTVAIHKTWAECQARVRGVSNARFKKAMSLEEENAIRKEWEQ